MTVVKAQVPGGARPLEDLAGPFGAVGTARRVKTDGWMPARCSMYAATTGDPSAVAGPCRTGAHAGSGTGRAYDDPAHARMIAVSEALERYASLLADEDTMTAGSATEIGPAAMDLDSVPRCSSRELSRPGCPLKVADKGQRIRWVTGVDLVSGRDVLVPAVMVSMGLSLWSAERFWLPISTGCAAHTSVEAATVNAICEVIERDAIALTWLQRLPLPRLAGERVTGAAAEIIAWCQNHGIATYLFDATTDVGIPTVYCVQTAENTDRAAQIVGCASDFDVGAAVLRALLETMGMRLGMHTRQQRPRRYAEYRKVSDGAAAMARPKQRPRFGFLLDKAGDRPVSSPAEPLAASASGRLAFLVRRLAELDMQVFAVDLSTREIDEAGLAVVHVIIPQLQPMSLRPLAQYRAHPRLFRAPAAMGMRALSERDLNPYPQPLA